MMNPSDTSLLRTRLRQINVEYSKLVRDKSETERVVRMHQLKTERQTLIALIATANSTGLSHLPPIVRSIANAP
jgi:hypothetical protein